MITDYGLDGKSTPEIIADLGARFRAYRLLAELTQREVAERANVSIFTISQFEKGAACNIGMATLLSLLRAIGFLEEIEKLLPELPPLPRQLLKEAQRRERIRHGK